MLLHHSELWTERFSNKYWLCPFRRSRPPCPPANVSKSEAEVSPKMAMIAGKAMNKEKVEEVKNILKQGRYATKEFVDVVFDLSERLFSALVSTDSQETIGQNLIPTKRIMNKKELAEFLGISSRLLSDLQNEGLPIVQFGKRILFDVEDVLEWGKGKKRKFQKSKSSVVRLNHATLGNGKFLK